MTKFGWSLPPGCGKLPYEDNDREDELEAFEAYLKSKDKLTDKYRIILDGENDELLNLIIEAIDWGWNNGSLSSKGDNGEYLNWLENKTLQEIENQKVNIMAVVDASMQRIYKTITNSKD